MTREIKFRCWNGYKNEWQDSDPIIDGQGVLRVSEGCEVSQFTGLLDKSGKEIYEGDIVKFLLELKDKPGEWSQRSVTFEYGIFKIGYHSIEKYALKLGDNGEYIPELEKVEVIGNVWESPERLTPVED